MTISEMAMDLGRNGKSILGLLSGVRVYRGIRPVIEK
jgi:hypothetical protein